MMNVTLSNQSNSGLSTANLNVVIVETVTSSSRNNVPVIDIPSNNVSDVQVEENLIGNNKPEVNVTPDVMGVVGNNNPPDIPVANEVMSNEDLVCFFCGGMPCEWPEVSQVIIPQAGMMYYTEVDSNWTNNF